MRVSSAGRRLFVWLASAGFFASVAGRALARGGLDSGRAADRGAGLPASIFGTYIEPGQLLVYPFFEFSRDHNLEYNPSKLGFDVDREYRGRYKATAEQIFIGYGVREALAFELEAARLSARLDKSTLDGSALPARLEQSGITDLEGQIRLRLMNETDHRPEFFAFSEITAPSQRNKRLIGDREWDVKPGLGAVRGYSWGTVTLRGTVEYTRDDKSLNIGEVAAEYLKRLAPPLRLSLGIEGGEGGAPDEWSLNSGLLWRVTDLASFKFDNQLALSSKATDWTPSAGILFTCPH